MLNQLFSDESGFIISAEIVLVLTIAVLSMIVGLSEVAAAINFELNDISNAIGALNQSYAYTGYASTSGSMLKGAIAGSAFVDCADTCDLNTSCEILAGGAGTAALEGPTL